MSVTPVIATKTVTTAGTRVQINSSGPTVVSVYFEALKTNTGIIYIGDVTVASTKYMTALSPGAGFNLSNGGGMANIGSEINLQSLYADCSVNGEKVQVTYITRV